MASDATVLRALAMLAGTDDGPGYLDRFQVRALPPTETREQPVVIWYCERDHDTEGRTEKGHVGIVARDMQLDQSGLTLGELVEAVLTHEREEHADVRQ